MTRTLRDFATFLLDVDGTLVDSTDAHARAWAETLAAHGHDVELLRIRRMIGMGGDRLVEQLTGYPRGSAKNEAITKERSKRFRERWLREVKPLPGARALVERLRDDGYRYAIASAAKQSELEPLLEIAGISDLISVKTTSSDVEESKPDPEIVQAALDRLGAPSAGAVMVGDTPYDIEAAHAARVEAIAFTSGGWSPDELRAAVAVFAGPQQLAEALRRAA